MTAAKRLIAKKLVATENITAICCTAQWAGTVPVDKQGRHLMNAIIWMDSRGADYTKQMISGLINIEGYELFKAIRWLRLTGGAPSQSGKDPVGHILYLQDKHPEICKQTFKFLEPKDYLNLRLTGKFAASYDSITLHWCTDNRDLSRVHYDDRLISMIGIERDQLPELKRAVDILGVIKPEVADQLGLSKSVQVVMGTPDVQSAALGSGAVEDYALVDLSCSL